MITKTQAYKSSDGMLFSTLEDAKFRSLFVLFNDLQDSPGQNDAIVKRILEKEAQLLDILTTKSRSRPARRSVNGFKRQRATANPQA